MKERFKFRVWDNERKCFFNDDEVVLYPNGEESFFNADYDFTECIVEQCTGLKDKNGKLIYEGDIVEIMVWDDYSEDMIETKGKVYWSKEDASFLIFVSYDGEYSLNSQETFYGQEIKVIGNIHENKELLDD